MAIYLFLLAFVAFLAFALRPDYCDGYKKVFVATCFSLLTVIASIRARSVGIDTGQFWDAYGAIGSTPWGALGNFRYEWGFLVLCKFLNYFSSDPQLLLVVSSCVINIPIGLFVYRNSRNVGLSTFLYVALCFYTSNMNIMREAMAVSMGLLAFEAMKKNHLIVSLVMITIAFLFHSTGAICLSFLLLWNIRFDERTILYYLALGTVFFIFSNQVASGVAFLLGREELYGADFTGSNYYGALIKALFAAFLVFITFNYYKVGKRAGKILSRPDNFYCHMLMLWLVCLSMGMRIEIISRMCMYFQLYSLIAIPDALYFSNSRYDETVLAIVVAIIAAVYFVVIGVYRPEWDGAIPYLVSSSIISFL